MIDPSTMTSLTSQLSASEASSAIGQLNLTTGLAIWGALVATASAAVQAYRIWTERSRLRVRAYMATFHERNSGLDGREVIVWSVTNAGKETIVVKSVGGAFSDGSHFVYTGRQIRYPHVLPAAHYFTEIQPIEKKHAKIAAMWAEDSLGRFWNASRKEISQMQAKVMREYLPEEE